MLTPKTKPVHGGILYVGGVEVAENGVKNTVWCYPPRHEKCNAYIDAIKLMGELEGDND